MRKTEGKREGGRERKRERERKSLAPREVHVSSWSLRDQVSDWTQVALLGRGLMEVQEGEHCHNGSSQQVKSTVGYGSSVRDILELI